MASLFQELDYRPTDLGTLILRRRWEPRLEAFIHEIKLGGDFVMTSAVTASEVALAERGLAALAQSRPAAAPSAAGAGGWAVAIGGLGLGYTARAALADDRVGQLVVVEYLDGVLDWHREGLLPLGPELTGDPRCRLVQGDFFALASSAEGVDPDTPGRTFDAVLVDIDHSPRQLLDPRSESFYQPAGLRQLARHLAPGGVFGLWSNDRPEDAIVARMAQAFAAAWAEPVTFHNPLQDKPFTQTVYLARTAR
ncbi:spermidine synthase [Rhodovibrio sodomensis]|uniref:Spermidine synthase n=1 Tax=Rhodovibrio sodomensis TaxID=1088 RepID=A0ABS1DPF2_9PROT|nr:spermidine synthase [Rhodovibrio sodomensis]MBK1671210.1 spermidine synthase [Rhodovibrio sodomensis]